MIAYTIWAGCEEKKERHFSAVSLLQRALEAAASSRHRSQVEAIILTNWGSVLEQAGDFQGAIAKFDAAIESNSGYSDAYFDKGCTLVKMHKPLRARKMFEMAIEADPNKADAYLEEVKILEQEHKIDAAITLLQRGRTNVPRNFDLLYRLAGLLKQSGKKLDALDAYERAIDVDPSKIEAYRDAADILAQCGGWLAARDELSRAERVAKDPQDREALDRDLARIRASTTSQPETATIRVVPCQ